MHARVTTISGSTDRVDDAIASYRSEVLPAVTEMGGSGAILLVDRQSGEAISLTLWPDEESMRASEERADQLRSTVSQQMDAGGQPSVGRFEVVVFET